MRAFLARRWPVLVLLLGACVGAAFNGYLLFGPDDSSRSWETCERIREGMTRQEVQAILRCPPGDYSTVPDF
jgi:hypothetical protein